MPAAFLMSDSGRYRAPDHDRSERRVDQDAKTEDLLLAGLDCYFAARYEDAIHVWSRALFFDRDHARARAYIERARRALAERQRESEELAQMGADAFRRGDIDTARTLLMSAIERGGVQDDVQVLLERLGRLQAGSDGVAASPRVWPRPSASRSTLTDERAVPASRGRQIVFVGVVLVLAAAALAVVASWARLDTSLGLSGAQATPTVAPAEFPLSRPSASEIALVRAQALNDAGRFHEALSALSRVRSSSTVRADADALQTIIQRALIAGVSAETR